MTNNRNRGFCIFLLCATFNIAIISIYYIIKHKAFAFIDIGSDTYTYYYPVQMEFARQLHQLKLITWSFSSGLGNNPAWQSNIFLLLEGIFPSSWQLGLRLPSYMLMLLLAGGFMFGYLRRLNFHPLIAVAGAMAYSFCGYATINGQWDIQGYVLAQLAGYLFCLEFYLFKRKSLYAIAAGLIVATGYVFDTYTFTVFTAFYLVARGLFIVEEGEARAYLSSVVRYIGWAALGAMLAAFTLLPNIIYLLSTSRVSGSSSVFESTASASLHLTNREQIVAGISGILGKNIFGVGSEFKGVINWFEAPGFYVSILLLTCIPQLLSPMATKKERRLAYSGLLLMAFYIVSPLIRYISFGFGHDGYRLSTLWVSFGLIVLGVTGLRHIYSRGTWRLGLVISTIGIILLTLLIAGFNREIIDYRHVVLLLMFSIGYCFMLWPDKSGAPRATILVIVVMLTGELALFSLPSFTERSAVAISASRSFDQQGTDTLAAVDFIKAREPKDKLFRIAKTYGQGFPNESMIMAYDGTTSYYLQDKSTVRFTEAMHLQPRPVSNIIRPILTRPVVLDLLGVKYILTTDQDADPGGLASYIKTFGSVKLYLNNGGLSVARLYDSLISEAAASAMTARGLDDILMKEVVVKDPSLIEERLATSHAYKAARNNVPQSISVRKISDTDLAVRAVADKPSVVLLAIPFNEGWSATLDSRNVTLFRADFGLTALVMPAGLHEINLRYSAPGRVLGCWLSIIALVLLIGSRLSLYSLGKVNSLFESG